MDPHIPRWNHRSCRAVRFCLVAFAALAIGGCGTGAGGVSGGGPGPIPVGNTPDPVTPAVPTPPIAFSNEAYGRDKVVKADLYWRFRWMVDTLAHDAAKDDFSSILTDTQKELDGTLADAFKPGLVQVMADIRAGQAAVDMEAKLRTDGVDALSLPWGVGRPTLEQMLNDKIAQAKQSGSEDAATKALEQDLPAILDWEEAQHRAPREVKASSLLGAASRDEAVADMMDRDRIAKGDHPIGRNLNPPHDYSALLGRGAASSLPAPDVAARLLRH